MKISSSGIKKVPRQYLSLITVRQYSRHNEPHFLVNIENCYEKILAKVLVYAGVRLWQLQQMTKCEDPSRYDPSGPCPPAAATSISPSFTSDGGRAGKVSQQAGGGGGGGGGGLVWFPRY